MYHNFNLNMTMKVHNIYHHLEDYMYLVGETFHGKSDEIVESTHSKLKKHEEAHNYRVNNIGSPSHVIKSHKSLVHWNSVNLGNKKYFK